MQVRVLGPVDVTVGSVPREVPGLRRKAVLAVLALGGPGIVSADHLIEGVWGGRPPRTALNTMQSHISSLRRLLGNAVIVTHPPGYLLTVDSDATDLVVAQRLIRQGQWAPDPVTSARHLRAALALWRDRALVDVATTPWLDAQAARLDAIRLDAVESLIRARLALGEHAQVVAELEQLGGQHPFREDLQRHLMLALYGVGRQADALAVYRRLRHGLGKELGIDPSPASRELELAILRQDAALDPRPAPPNRRTPATDSEAVSRPRADRRARNVVAT